MYFHKWQNNLAFRYPFFERSDLMREFQLSSF